MDDAQWYYAEVVAEKIAPGAWKVTPRHGNGEDCVILSSKDFYSLFTEQQMPEDSKNQA